MEFNEIDLNDRLQRGSDLPNELHNHEMVKKLVSEIYQKLAALSNEK